MARKPLRCAKCGSPETKANPDEFDSARWPFRSASVSVKMAGGPDPSRRILVCLSCGENRDMARAELD